METPKQATLNVHLPKEAYETLKRLAQKDRRSLKQYVAVVLMAHVGASNKKVPEVA